MHSASFDGFSEENYMFCGFSPQWRLEHANSINIAQSLNMFLKYCGVQISRYDEEHYLVFQPTLITLPNGLWTCWPKNVKAILPLMKIFVTAELLLL